MKTKTILPFVIVLLILLSIPRALAPPLPPCIFYGYVSVGGKPAADGLNVTAVISGTTLNWTTETSNGTYGWPYMGSSYLQIPTNNPDTAGKNGGATGDWVVFYVQGVKNVQTGYFDPGTPERLDLSVPEISGPLGSRFNSTLTATLDPSVYAGDKVDVGGRLALTGGTSIGGASLSITCMNVVEASWESVASATTSPSGNYLAQWTPNSTGNYAVKVSWEGNQTVEGAEANLGLALTSSEGAYVFSVVSNSTVSDIVYNSTLGVLNFTLTGPSGTTGYTNVAVPKDLVGNITGLTVQLDQDTVNYAVTSNPAFWMLHFTYTQSTHKVTVNLPAKPAPPSQSPPFLETPLGIVTLFVIVMSAAALIYVARGKLKQPDEKLRKLPKNPSSKKPR